MRIKILEPEGEYTDAQIWAAQAEVESPPNPFFHAFRPLDVARAIHWAHFTDWALFPHVQRFQDIPDLLERLLTADLYELSQGMRRFNEDALLDARELWTRIARRLSASVAAGNK